VPWLGGEAQGRGARARPALGLADRTRLDTGLIQEGVVQGLVGRLVRQAVVGLTADGLWDLGLVGGIEEDRDEAVGGAAGVVELLGDDGPLPIDTLTLAGLLVAAEAAVVVGVQTNRTRLAWSSPSSIQRGQPWAGVPLT
jgi:hypothetical protein